MDELTDARREGRLTGVGISRPTTPARGSHRIRAVRAADAGAITNIYNHYITDTIITFEEQPINAAEMSRRIADVTTTLPWIVMEAGEQIVGYAYASAWRQRSAYRHSMESTVYLDPHAAGRGYGSALYEALLADLRRRDVHAVFGVVSLPNPASVALHEKFGFVKVGHLVDAGRKFDRWVDVGYWQLLF